MYQGKASNAWQLLKIGADIEAKIKVGRTPIMSVIIYNQISTLEILIEDGARTDVVHK